MAIGRAIAKLSGMCFINKLLEIASRLNMLAKPQSSLAAGALLGKIEKTRPQSLQGIAQLVLRILN